MSKFDHPHIIRLIGVCTDRSPIFIVMELCEKGSLREYLQKNENYFDQQNLHLIRYVKQLASALSYLESQSFVHRYEKLKSKETQSELEQSRFELDQSQSGLEQTQFESEQSQSESEQSRFESDQSQSETEQFHFELEQFKSESE